MDEAGKPTLFGGYEVKRTFGDRVWVCSGAMLIGSLVASSRSSSSASGAGAQGCREAFSERTIPSPHFSSGD